jgi:hypothetical protein
LRCTSSASSVDDDGRGVVSFDFGGDRGVVEVEFGVEVDAEDDDDDEVAATYTLYCQQRHCHNDDQALGVATQHTEEDVGMVLKRSYHIETYVRTDRSSTCFSATSTGSSNLAIESLFSAVSNARRKLVKRSD